MQKKFNFSYRAINDPTEDDIFHKASTSSKKGSKSGKKEKDVFPGYDNRVKKKVVGGGGIITKYDSPFRYAFWIS